MEGYAVTPKLILLVWHDASGSATKVYEEARDHQPTVMTSVGWLMQSDQIGVSICSEQYTEDGVTQWRGHTFVPRGMCVSETAIHSHVVAESGR